MKEGFADRQDIANCRVVFATENNKISREEKIKHKKRMRKLENLYRHNLRRMRKTLEVKLEKSATVLEEQREERKRKITEYVSLSNGPVYIN